MLTISNRGIITVNRGDDFSVPLFINQGTKLNPERYELKIGDEIYVGVSKAGADIQVDYDKTKYFVEVDEEENETVYLGIPEVDTYYKTALIRKTLTVNNIGESGDLILKFTHNDTKFLLPGNYVYQIRAKIIKDGEEIINTLCNKTLFVIL